MLGVTSKDYYTFCFLPYLQIHEKIQIGPVEFWPFREYKDSEIGDRIHLEQISKFINQYRLPPPTDTNLNVTMISLHGEPIFKNASGIDGDIISEAVLSLFAGSVIKNNNMAARTANDFKLIYQNYIPGVDRVSISSGSIVSYTDGGYRIDEITHYKPTNVATTRPYPYEIGLMHGLGNLMTSKKHRIFSRRMFNALSWLANAYSNDDGFDYSQRIVAMSTAYEFLLNGFSGRWGFVNKISELVQDGTNKWPKFYSNRIVVRSKKRVNERHSFLEWWCLEFYQLRNSIVHGDEIRSSAYMNRKGHSHFLVAVRVFDQALKRLLHHHGYYHYSYSDEYLCRRLFEML